MTSKIYPVLILNLFIRPFSWPIKSDKGKVWLWPSKSHLAIYKQEILSNLWLIWLMRILSEIDSTPIFDGLWTRIIQWIGLRENSQETMVFTIKYGFFL